MTRCHGLTWLHPVLDLVEVRGLQQGGVHHSEDHTFTTNFTVMCKLICVGIEMRILILINETDRV